MRVKIDRLEVAIVAESDDEARLLKRVGGVYDRKTRTWRMLPYKYSLVRDGLKERFPVREELPSSWRMADRFSSRLKKKFELRDYQRRALRELRSRGWRGVIVLPTGAGKTIIGIAAIHELREKTLIVVPTLDLMNQWLSKISGMLGISKADIATYGGGRKRFGEITVATYASAKTKEFLEAAISRFGLVIFDEAHHLTGELNREIARRLLAPHRIGLTATPGDRESVELLKEIVGDVIKLGGFKELVSKGYLAPFEHRRIYVRLTQEEARRYKELMDRYLSYVKRYGEMDEIERFRRLLRDAARDPEARRALLARLEAKKIALSARKKFEVLAELLEKHREDKVIIFTRHQEAAKRISITFGIPYVIGDMPKEARREVLGLFRTGRVSKIVAAEVLDEGIDIPSASVGIIVAGKPSKLQLIQRIGRLLRPMEGKKAVIYEVITSGTYDYFAARKRRIREEEL